MEKIALPPVPCDMRLVTDLDVARVHEQEASASATADEKAYDQAVANYRREVPLFDRAVGATATAIDNATLWMLPPMDVLYFRPFYTVAGVTRALSVAPLEKKLAASTSLRDFWRREIARDQRAVVAAAAKPRTCTTTATADDVMRESKAWADVLVAHAKGPVVDGSPELAAYNQAVKDIPHAPGARGALMPIHRDISAFGLDYHTPVTAGDTWKGASDSFINTYRKSLETVRQPL